MRYQRLLDAIIVHQRDLYTKINVKMLVLNLIKVYRGWIINTFTYVLYFLLFEKGNEETIK